MVLEHAQEIVLTYFDNPIVAPVIREKPRIIRIEKKKTVIIECRVRCAAPPQVQWFQEKTVVKEDHRRVTKVEQVEKVNHK